MRKKFKRIITIIGKHNQNNKITNHANQEVYGTQIGGGGAPHPHIWRMRRGQDSPQRQGQRHRSYSQAVR